MYPTEILCNLFAVHLADSSPGIYQENLGDLGWARKQSRTAVHHHRYSALQAVFHGARMHFSARLNLLAPCLRWLPQARKLKKRFRTVRVSERVETKGTTVVWSIGITFAIPASKSVCVFKLKFERVKFKPTTSNYFKINAVTSYYVVSKLNYVSNVDTYP